MAIVDLIIKVGKDSTIIDVICLGTNAEKHKKDAYDCLVGQNVDYALGIIDKNEEGVIELQGVFYKYQWVEGRGYRTVFLSHESMLLDFFKQTINYIPEGVQIYDKNGYFIHANPASEKLEQFKIDDFKGRHLLDIYDLNEEFSTTLSVLRTQKPVMNRCDRFKTMKGKILTTINSGYPLIIENKTYGAVVFESDSSVMRDMRSKYANLEVYVEEHQSKPSDALYTFEDIIHESDRMRQIINFAKKVSLTDSSVILVGATGTGKELVAQGIHSFGHRRYKPFVGVNCSAIPDNLFESMFFGTEKGAFTGSISKKGFFEMANGGTLFLDEINSIHPDMQAKLLRVLQEKRFQRIGGSQDIKCDTRIIVAVNENINELLTQQKIRRDFYYRISTIKIELPPLVERKEDIPLLAQYFLDALCSRYDRQQAVFDDVTMERLMSFDWPGNVRELQHVVEYAFNDAVEDTEVLRTHNLPDYLGLNPCGEKDEGYWNNNLEELAVSNSSFEDWMARAEREIIRRMLVQYRGNVTQSAKALGMSRQNLQYRMRKLGLIR